MTENTPTLGKIFQAIPKIMNDLEAIGKDQKNQQQNFNFRGIDDVYNGLQKTMAKHGVFTVPEIVGRHRERFTKKGKHGDVEGYHIINNYKWKFYCEDGSFVEAFTDGEAIDYGDKSASKAGSIAHKYALLQVFCIPTKDLEDPDHHSPHLNEKGAPVQRQYANRPSPNGNANPLRPLTQKEFDSILMYADSIGVDRNEIMSSFKQQIGRDLTQATEGDLVMIRAMVKRLEEAVKQ